MVQAILLPGLAMPFDKKLASPNDEVLIIVLAEDRVLYPQGHGLCKVLCPFLFLFFLGDLKSLPCILRQSSQSPWFGKGNLVIVHGVL